MPRDPRVLIEDMLEAVTRIERYTGGFEASFLNDPRTMDAVIRNLEIIGEAAKSLPDAERQQMAQIEWRKIAGLRDILAHQYFGIDSQIVADVVASKLGNLRDALRNHQG
jgi:uncharacterized protein with HEPN domain